MASIPQLITNYASTAGVNPAIALEVGIQESNLNQAAIGSKGEIGIFQLMPGTAQQLGVDPTDTEQNILGGTTYLGQLYSQFNDDPVAMLAAYNAGPGTVANLQAQYGADWFNYLPASTQSYVQNILANAQQQQTATFSPAAAVQSVGQTVSDAASEAIDTITAAVSAPQSSWSTVLLWGGIAVVGFFLLEDYLGA